MSVKHTDRKGRTWHLHEKATAKGNRAFTVERYCFRGSVDGWIFLDGPGALSTLVRKYVKHLGRESFFELI